MQVLADDADIFVLLVYFIWYYKQLAYISNGKIIDLTGTAEKLRNKCSDLLPVHALSECDTVSFDLDLSVFANTNSEESKWMVVGICFLFLLYGELNDLRHRIIGNTKEPTQ